MGTAFAGRKAHAYHPGHVFGARMLRERSHDAAAQVRLFRRNEKSGMKMTWGQLDTKLGEYFHLAKEGLFAGADFRAYLNGKCAKARAPLRVLDLGAGSGAQWLEFAHNPRFELYITSLTIDEAHPCVANRAVACDAASLHAHFREGRFDIIVSNFGTHAQEYEAFENILWLLKRGGEAIVSGTLKNVCPPLFAERMLGEGSRFKILHAEEFLFEDVFKRILWNWDYKVKKL